MSLLVEIADAVAAALNGGNFSQPFEARRLHQPSFELKDLDELRVSVVPKSQEIAPISRASSAFDCAVDVGVQKKVDPADLPQVDALLDLVEEIVKHLNQRRLDGLPDAGFVSIKWEPVVVAEHLDQLRVFTSVATVTYQVCG